MRALELLLPTGLIRGIGAGDVAHWRGLPYAAPPVGVLRWQGPQPPEQWTGFREAGTFGPSCPQPRGMFKGVPKGLGLAGPGRPIQRSEDCLTLNVTAPADPASDSLPVMVFLHGGGFISGAGSDPAYDGSALVRRGQVIYVSLNYRLGAWGWLPFDEYATSDLPIESNLGLRDQLAALRWVRDNIAVFGGDPDRVTLFGESAGAIAISALLAAPAAAGLFSGAILQSPAPRVVPPIERARQWSREFLRYLDVDPDDAAGVRARLASVPPAELITALSQLSFAGLADDPGAIPVTPNADGELLPHAPLHALSAGSGLPVPVIIGTNDREGTLFSHFSPTSPTLRPTWRQMVLTAQSIVDAAGVLEVVDDDPRTLLRTLYPGYPHNRGARADLAGDSAFWYPSVELTEACSAYQPTWSYRFDYAPRLLNALRVNATHGSELLPVFGRFDTDLARFVMLLGGKDEYARLTDAMQEQWLHFVHHQRPTDAWPRYDLSDRATMIFDATSRIDHDPRGDRRRAWASVVQGASVAPTPLG